MFSSSHQIRSLTLALTVGILTAGCPRTETETIRFGVDASLEELGLGEFIQAAFEDKTKTKTKLIYAGTEKLFELARAGDIDTAFIVSEDALRKLDKDGVVIRSGTYAHEEFMWIGPFEDHLGRHAEAKGIEFLQNVARTNYKTLKGKKGSVEYARFTKMFREGKDAAEPGAWFDTDFEGSELAVSAIQRNTFAMVKRSSLLIAAKKGIRAHKIYIHGDPELVLRMVVVEVHPGRTRRPRHPELYDFILSPDGEKIIETFGVKRLGLPVYVSGEPDEGEGAKVDVVKARPKPVEPTEPKP